MPLLIDPYLEWKHNRVISCPEIELNIVWSIPVLGFEGLFGSLDVLLLIRSLASSLPTVTMQQHEGKNANIVLMHISLIVGTPVLPKLVFSVILLESFYLLHR